MKADCHMHMVLDGVNWKSAIARHRDNPQEDFIRNALQTYKDLGYTYLRDGGDKWGVGAKARELAPDYGITYRTPLSPLCKAGHYGAFIGTAFENAAEFARQVVNIRKNGGDFIKIMISGLMDFHQFGVLSEPGLAQKEITELVHIAKEEGMSVMVHANGADTVIAAAEAGVDSVEHGAYLDRNALDAMKDAGAVWVPTLSTIGNLLGKGRFPDDQVKEILDSALQNVSDFAEMGGLLASGTDAGAWAVPHGSATEEGYFAAAGVGEDVLAQGLEVIRQKF
ncbi:MAG: amidohydrolase family protein [Oscillospiraceae bacterium]|nr:amidohydrolase family protein [Oscillospiraceae bacterium]